MKTTSIYTWYKKVTNLISKNIAAINSHDLSIDVCFMDTREDIISVNVGIFRHKNGECKSIYRLSIANYKEEKFNRQHFNDFKKFLENIETLS